MPRREGRRVGISAKDGFAERLLVFIAVVTLIWLAIPLPAAAHKVDCAGRTGNDLARCERHQAMAAKCGPIQGEAHFVCNREFLLAHPLRCEALTGDDTKRCEAERAAFKTCEPQGGRAFLVCVRDTTMASPMER